MGNVECCSSAGRFSKPHKEKKIKKKTKKGDRNVVKNGEVLTKVEPVIEKEPLETVVEEPDSNSQDYDGKEGKEDSGSSRESVAVARQRFFGEVRTGDHNGGVPEVFLGTSDPHHGFPEFSLDGGTGFKHNGSSGGVGYDAASLMESLKKNSLLRQNKTQLTSSASQQMVSSSTKSSSSISSSASNQRLQAGRRQNLTASELKARSDLNELNHSLSEMTELSRRMRRSMENIVDRDDLDERQLPDIRDMGDMSDIGDMSEIGGSPVVSFPDADTPPIMPTQNLGLVLGNNAVASSASAASNKMNIKQSRVVTEGFHSSISAENQMQHSDLSFEEKMNTRQLRNKLLTESIYAQKNLHNLQEQRSMKSGDSASAESRNLSASTMELKTKAFSSEASAMSAAGSVAGARMQQQHAGARMQQQHSSVQHSNMTITSKNMSSKSSLLSANSQGMVEATITTPVDDDLSGLSFEDLDRLGPTSNPKEVEMTIQKFSSRIDAFMRSLPKKKHIANTPQHFKKLNDIVKKAWAVPGHGHDLGYSLCNTLRTSGGLDVILENCRDNDPALKIASASLLEQCLTTENREYVVENGLETIVKIACACTKSEQASENSSEGSEGKSEQENRRTSSNEGTMTVACASKKQSQTDHARVGTGILEHLFKHSEGACGDVVRLGGLDAVLFECRKNDVETLRHCASALANLSLYGGAENQEAMIKSKVPMWLFPLAFHNDDNVKYYACLAIAALVANKEIEAEVLKSGTLELVEPFVTSHNPSEFARSNLAYAHGQSKEWLRRLVPVLSSKREEARNLAAFHFCMEAGIKKRQGNTEIFREIGAVDALKQVASCPNAVASKYAAQALRLMGEEIPHKLSQQVPLWSIEDVREWVKQIGFTEYANNFVESRVDGDLLLQLTEENLTQDIGLKNGIKRKRFTRELQNLKKMADYSSRDSGSLNQFLQSIGPEYTIYTYSMLNAGVDNNSMKGLSEDHLDNECMIRNAIHRLRILNQIKTHLSTLPSTSEESLDKPLDVFVSYRRSNGSQLASLLKVHLELRGFSVFIDVERLEAGKFDNNLLQSIKQAKHFLLVLTPNALERCKEDHEQKDWVHREIVAALQSNCNIIPIIDNFTWPEPEELPVDMRPVCTFNGVLWIHDYQDACVEKLERFLRGELTTRSESRLRDLSTPLPSASRAHPSYQRMPSQESKTSEKDCPASSKD